MDKKKSILNVVVAVFFKIILLVLTLVTRRFLIKYVGNEANGVFSLYTSLLGFLAVADLGIGVSITFSMYKPIVENDVYKVSALYKMYVKIYRVVASIIFIVGLLLLPTLPYLAKDYSADFNLYYTFILMLLSVVLSYTFSAKVSLINAYKNTYITTAFHSIALIIEAILQIILLIYLKSFEWYLISRLISVCIEWLLVDFYHKKKYKCMLISNAEISKSDKSEIINNSKAMFMHKIGYIMTNTSDSLIISSFVGVVLLGKYSNYTTIIVAMLNIISLLFTPLTSVIGHLCVEKSNEDKVKYFNIFFNINFILGIVFYLGYYAVINNVIYLFFGPNLEIANDIVFVLTLNYFIQFLRQTVIVFRDATGTFYYDRYRPIAEGLINIILSLISVKYLGVLGVILATIITNLLSCYLIEPTVLFKHAFTSSAKKYLIKQYAFVLIFFLAMIVFSFVKVQSNNIWLSFFANGFISVAISCGILIMVYLLDRDLRMETKNIIRKLILKIKK